MSFWESAINGKDLESLNLIRLHVDVVKPSNSYCLNISITLLPTQAWT